MIEGCRTHFCHFNTNWIEEAAGKFSIVEKSKTGAGSAIFEVAAPSVILRAANQAPLIWALAQRKCADGAFLTFDADGKAHLHLVELKSKLSLGEWVKALHQFEGMFLTAVAVCRLLSVTDFASVRCYIASKVEAVEQSAGASPALLKGKVGGSKTFGRLEEWKKSAIQLPFDFHAALSKASRNAAGDADFGLVG